MNQYQRLISYLYRYEEGIKKENTGYARIELQGELCKITVQLQENKQNIFGQQPPDVSLFVQREWGIERIAAGQMLRNGYGYRCCIKTKADDILDSGKMFSELDGLLVYLNDDWFYATTWKDILLHLGQKEAKKQVPLIGDVQEQQEQPEIVEKGDEQPTISEKKDEKPETETIEMQETSEGMKPEPELIAAENEAEKQNEAFKKQKHNIANSGEKHTVDFGKQILSMFPKMYPFEIEKMEECVRLELKDIGCLPVAYWWLAGNPLLMQGYYCYRHILFARTAEGRYCIGVPGIYCRENRKKAESCGFFSFQSISDVKELQGAFGYWLYEMEH